MNRIVPRQPLGLKEPKAKRDFEYMERVSQLPCVICQAFGLPQESPTEVHHWIMGRGQQTRTPDGETLPLCDGHHQGLFDKTKVAIHREPERWKRLYGEDHEYIEVTQDAVERLANGTR